MTITAHATNQLAPLTVYVIGIDSRDDNAIGPADAAYGIYFDSARLATFNSSGAFHSTKKYSAGDQQALFKGIRKVIRNAPAGRSLIIESDVEWFVNQFNGAYHRRRTVEEPEERMESEHETPILDLIDFRTRKDDCFVEIVYSAKDPTAKKGFREARNLARKALAAFVAEA